MITWIFGRSGAGKSHLAKRLCTGCTVWLDGDALRSIWDLGFTEAERREQNRRVAGLAKLFDDQGHDVVISTICPYRNQRQDISQGMRVQWIYLPGGKKDDQFEEP